MKRCLIFALIRLVVGSRKVAGFSPTKICLPSSVERQARSTVGLFASISSSVETHPKLQNRTSTSSRPLHQNWWPVSLVDALDPTRPNAIELLGMRLVLIPKGDGDWTCLDDRCSHRFAPLSEGRIVQSPTGEACGVQCAYHGWEFDDSGACTRVPQMETSGGVVGKCVHSYPVQTKVGMVWVWSDWASTSVSDSVSLPISPLMERYYAVHGLSAGFMRDLPYGMEILGENLLDLSHLPFSHHSVGSLHRDLGGALPLRMLSDSEKVERASGEAVVPLFQAEVRDAAEHDPMFLGLAKAMGSAMVPKNATTTIAFFDPCHVRYHRVGLNGMATNVQLFMCPTRTGKSRVILYNLFEMMLPPVNATKEVKQSLWDRLAIMSPNALMGKAKKALMFRFFNPASVNGHMLSHAIFDGDGIFLHKQGDRMRRSGLTYRDYATPSSADVLLNAYRRWLDSSALKASQLGAKAASDSVGPDAYFDEEPRSELLDRYESHTAHCKICSAALEKCRRRRDRLAVVSNALTGAAGASMTALAALSAISVSGGASIAPIVLGIAGLSALATTAGSFAAARASRKMNKESDKFLFEDYVHAEKP